jgi:hypothetical protein
MFLQERRLKVLERLLLMFLFLQPFLDLLTSLSIRLFQINLTFGLFIRFGFLFIGVIYLLFLKTYDERKKTFLYLCIIALILGINIINNYFIKIPFSLSEEFKYILKAAYFLITLLVYAVIFKKIDRDDLEKKALYYAVYAMTVIGASMVVAELTGTSFQSYSGGKIGSVGWFFAGNEIGAILAIGFPIVVLVALKGSKWSWISVFLTIYSLLSLGTKVGYITILLVLAIGLIFSLFDYFRKKTMHVKISFINIIIVFCFLLGVIFYTPYAPIAKNMDLQMSWLGINKNTTTPDANHKQIKKPIEKENNVEITSDQVQNLVFSGRDQFLNQHKSFFREAPLSQKLFGMGLGGNYEKVPKMVEMDFYDIFFSFGIIGSILYLLPLLYFGLKILVNFFRRLKENFYYENILIGTSIVLGLGIAYTAGHVITAPAVSIYLAFIVTYFSSKLNVK